MTLYQVKLRTDHNKRIMDISDQHLNNWIDLIQWMVKIRN